MVHLGLGAFHRAHQAWYTQLANEQGDTWGIEAFTGRTATAAEALSAQDCLYTLIERNGEADSASIIESISAASDGADAIRWRRAFADPAVVVVTLTVTEAGYRRALQGGIEWSDPQVQRDLGLLCADAEQAAMTAPGRLVDGLRARMRGSATPIAIVSCDNLAENGRVTHDVVLALASRVDGILAAWIDRNVSFVSTMVDRITPATTHADVETALTMTGLHDAVPVVTEPFSEWVLSGDFPGGRPAWDRVGARFVDDIAPYEQRKLWLLNAGHSLLAYRGLLRGHRTIAEAMADAECAAALEQLWGEARAVLVLESTEVDAVLNALRIRFTNARIEHLLSQIAMDGSQKLSLRVVDIIRRRIGTGLPAGDAAVGVLAAWALHLSGPHRCDPRADRLADKIAAQPSTEQAAAVLTFLAPDLATDVSLNAQIAAQIDSLVASRSGSAR